MVVLETKGIHRWILTKYWVSAFHIASQLLAVQKFERRVLYMYHYLSNILSFETLQIVSIHLALYYGCPNIQGNCRC